MIVMLWNRSDRGLGRLSRLHTALAHLPRITPGGALHAFAAMARTRAVRPHTVALSLLRA